MKDAYDDPLKRPPFDRRRKTHFGGEERERRLDDARRVDGLLARLADEEQVRAGSVAADDLATRMITARDRQYRQGSYAELERALGRLRDEQPVAYQVAMWVAYQALEEAPVEPVKGSVVSVCEQLVGWMPATIRVPADVAVYTDEELARQSREAADALAHGRSEWASASRAARKRMILVLALEGLSDGQIARRLGLSRSRVQQIRAGIVEAVDNGGEVAA